MKRPTSLFRIHLGSQHPPTGNTRHFAGDSLLPPPVALEIVRYPGDEGYYLLYLDENGLEQTDTWHQTPEAAFRQAEFEFSIAEADWVPNK